MFHLQIKILSFCCDLGFIMYTLQSKLSKEVSTDKKISSKSSSFCSLCEDTLHLYSDSLTNPELEIMINTDLKFRCRITGNYEATVRML